MAKAWAELGDRLRRKAEAAEDVDGSPECPRRSLGCRGVVPRCSRSPKRGATHGAPSHGCGRRCAMAWGNSCTQPRGSWARVICAGFLGLCAVDGLRHCLRWSVGCLAGHSCRPWTVGLL